MRIVEKLFGKKLRPHSELFGLKFRDNEEHKIILLDCTEKRFNGIQHKFVKLVLNADSMSMKNLKSLEDFLNLMMIELKRLKETAEYLSKYADLPADGKLFGLRLRLEKFLNQVFEYRILLKYYSPFPDTQKYFKYNVNINNGYLYGLDIGVNTYDILNRFKEIYDLQIAQGEIEHVY